MTELKPGLKGCAETLVAPGNTAADIGSGALPVFSTPHMIALMEKAAMDAIAPCLEEGQGSVGTNINVSHLAASPIGMKVRAESELTAVDRRMRRCVRPRLHRRLDHAQLGEFGARHPRGPAPQVFDSQSRLLQRPDPAHPLAA